MASGLEFGGFSGSPWAVGGGMDIQVPKSSETGLTGSPEATQGALESTLELVKKSLWDIERHTSDTQSRLDVNNQSGPTSHIKKMTRWAADDWALDIMNETLPEIRDAIEDLGGSKDNFLTRGLESIKDILANSAIARKSDSPLETSLASLRESTVSFNEKTMRWHDTQSNLMVKGDDPRVAEAMKPEPEPEKEAVEAEIHWGATITGFLEDITHGINYIAEGMKLVVHRLYNPEKEKEDKNKEEKEEEKSEEDQDEEKTANKKGAKNEKKQTTILGGMWESLKEKGKKSWLADNWGKILIGLTFLFAPLKWIKGIWNFVTGPFWEFFKENPIITTLGLLATWFLGGAFLSSLATSLVSAIGAALTGGAFWAGIGSAIGTAGSFLKAFAVGGLASPLAIIAALFTALIDGVMGWVKSGDWGVSKIGGFLGGMFAGSKGWVGMFTNMGKWAVAGAVAGFPFFGIGAIPGGLVGAALGAIFNFIGGKRMAQAFDNVLGIFKELLLLPIKLAKFLFKWTIVKPFAWLFKKIASSDIWKSMVASWSKGWNELVSDLTEVWDSFTWIFREAGKQLGKIWDWLVDPKTIISGDLIMGLVDPIIQWFKDLFSFDFSMPDWDIGEGLKAAVRGIISGIPGWLVPDAIEEWAEGKGEEGKEEEKPKTKAEIVEEKKQEQKDIIATEEEKIKKSQLHMAGEGEDVYGPTLDNVLGLELVGQRQSLEAIEEATKALLKIRVDDRRARVSAAEKIAKKSGKMSEEEYRKSARGIADRTDVDDNLIGMSKEEQAQLYEEYVGTRPKEGAEQISKPTNAIDQIVQSAKEQWGFGGKNKKVIQEAKDVAKKLIRSYDKHDAKGSRTKGLRHGVKQRMSGTLKSASPGARAAMVEELQGTALGDQMKKSFGDDFIAPDLREVKGAEGMATETGGLDMLSEDFAMRTTKSFETSSMRGQAGKKASDAFTAQMTGDADKKMDTFNSVQEKNRTLQDGKSSVPIIIRSDSKNTNIKSGDLNTYLPSPVHAGRITTSLAKD